MFHPRHSLGHLTRCRALDVVFRFLDLPSDMIDRAVSILVAGTSGGHDGWVPALASDYGFPRETANSKAKAGQKRNKHVLYITIHPYFMH
jgi:hypothetical protein